MTDELDVVILLHKVNTSYATLNNVIEDWEDLMKYHKSFVIESTETESDEEELATTFKELRSALSSSLIRDISINKDFKKALLHRASGQP